MVLAIVAAVVGFLTCCIGAIFGIIGIVFASQVNSKWQQGDVAGAADAARKARTFSMIGIVLAVIALVVDIILIATGNFSFYTY